MTVLQVAEDKLSLALKELREFNANYNNLTDYERLVKANLIFDSVNSYMRIKKNLLFPLIAKTERYNDLLERSAPIDESINHIIELSQMLHVDEPNFEFYDNMVNLQAMVEDLQETDQSSVFAWCRTYLTPEQEAFLNSNLKVELSHESMPSSGPPYR